MLHIRTLEDFAAAWQGESENTAKVLARLTDAALSRRVWAEGRELGYLAWHLPISIAEMLGAAGLEPVGPKHDAIAPQSAQAIHDEYVRAAASVIGAVTARWKDASLGDMIPMYGQAWTKGQVLGCLLVHEVHHRGQITVLMRQAGLLAPGVYGPAKEEWAQMGMPAMP